MLPICLLPARPHERTHSHSLELWPRSSFAHLLLLSRALGCLFACRWRSRSHSRQCAVRVHACRKSKELETSMTSITGTLRNMELNEAKVPCPALPCRDVHYSISFS